MPAERRNNFYEQFAATAERFPTRPAVEVQRRDSLDRFTYADLRSMADHVAGFLAAHGSPGASRLGRGDGCAILADNDARWCAAYLGVLQLGCVAVPLDTAYKGPQIAALLRDSGARVLFTAPKYLPAACAWTSATRSSACSRCSTPSHKWPICCCHSRAEPELSSWSR